MATVARVLSRRLPAAQSDVETLKDSGHVFWSRPGRVAVSGGERAGYQRRILVTATSIVQDSARDPREAVSFIHGHETMLGSDEAIFIASRRHPETGA